ncbi:MAG: glycosyltransferase family A protein [Isosphaeraceae bacterium]
MMTGQTLPSGAERAAGMASAPAATRPSPTVSVVMAAYNVEKYAAEAVESILGQTYRDFEFLIVDDGSTDGTLAILRRFAERDPRIRLWTRENRGVPASSNELIDLAQGEFIARMDCDDVALPERLECQVKFLREHPECVAVGSQALLVDPEGDPLCVWFSNQTHEEIEAGLVSGGRGDYMCHPVSMIRRQALIDVGKYDLRYAVASDRDVFLRLAERGRLANLPRVLLKYRANVGSISHRAERKQIELVGKMVNEARRRRNLGDIEPPAATEAMDPAIPIERKWAWWALASGHIGTARKHAWRVLRKQPLSPETYRLLYCALRGR